MSRERDTSGIGNALMSSCLATSINADRDREMPIPRTPAATTLDTTVLAVSPVGRLIMANLDSNVDERTPFGVTHSFHPVEGYGVK